MSFVKYKYNAINSRMTFCNLIYLFLAYKQALMSNLYDELFEMLLIIICESQIENIYLGFCKSLS
jgi:hypothetical protein